MSDISYEGVIHFAHTAGLVLMVACFAIALIYAVWPSNKDEFQRAAHAPLEDDAHEQ